MHGEISAEGVSILSQLARPVDVRAATPMTSWKVLAALVRSRYRSRLCHKGEQARPCVHRYMQRDLVRASQVLGRLLRSDQCPCPRVVGIDAVAIAL